MARLKGSPRNRMKDLPLAATENAHFILPTNTIPKYRVVVCGASEELTGRKKLLERYGRDPEDVTRHAQIFSLGGRSYVVELIHVHPNWCHGPLLDYHSQYSHAFAFVVTPSSRDTLEAATEMREMVLRYIKSHAMELSERDQRPMILIANLDETLRPPESHTGARKETTGRHTAAQRDKPSASSEIITLADKWACDYDEIDTSKERGNGVADVVYGLLERLVDLKVQAAEHSPASEDSTVETPRSFLLRRVLGHLAPAGLFGSKR